jgi:hypothetical protein
VEDEKGENMDRKLQLTVAFFALFQTAGLVVAAGAFGLSRDQPATMIGEPVEQLRAIGRKVAAAVLNHDIETLLSYDRPDLRDGDRLELQDRKSYLYCRLFDRQCLTTGRSSIYDILSKARHLGIEARMLGTKGAPPHGLILFFDATQVRKSKLRSASFLCELSLRDQIVSWSFKLENGAWVSATPIFDLETDTLCSP